MKALWHRIALFLGHMDKPTWLMVACSLLGLLVVVQWYRAHRFMRAPRREVVDVIRDFEHVDDDYWCFKCEHLSRRGEYTRYGPQKDDNLCTGKWRWWRPWGCPVRLPQHFHVKCASCGHASVMATADAPRRGRVSRTVQRTAQATEPEPQPEHKPATQKKGKAKKVPTLWERLREDD